MELHIIRYRQALIPYIEENPQYNIFFSSILRRIEVNLGIEGILLDYFSPLLYLNFDILKLLLFPVANLTVIKLILITFYI